MAQEIGILSGTRDDLGGVEVAIANVYERPERPGAPSGGCQARASRKAAEAPQPATAASTSEISP